MEKGIVEKTFCEKESRCLAGNCREWKKLQPHRGSKWWERADSLCKSPVCAGLRDTWELPRMLQKKWKKKKNERFEILDRGYLTKKGSPRMTVSGKQKSVHLERSKRREGSGRRESPEKKKLVDYLMFEHLEE